jgi:hypothetical protein
VVRTGGKSTVTGAEGRFRIRGVGAGEVRIARPAWRGRKVAWDGEPLGKVPLEPRVVRALRAIPDVAGDADRYDALLDLAEMTSVNAIVFDTKDETGMVRYETKVKKAARLGAIDATYDPNDAIEAAKARGFYTITRVVTFEDSTWASADPGAKLAGNWVNPADKDNWTYPLALAVEACRAGFDEIQFDYVHFPAGTTAEVAEERQPLTQEQRVAAIRGFLRTAKGRLHEQGCAISADIFGIVVSSPTDEGIGQRLEDLSAMVDAVSPMIYPSHYSAGWLGYDDPNDHPGAVTADALDDAAPRLHPTTILRPWLQGFYWTDHQVRTAIDATENRGHGWLVWNAAGNYDRDAIPPK